MDSAVSRRSPKAAPVSGANGGGAVSNRVPKRTTLDGFAQEVAATEGVNVRAAEPLVTILVTTRNSRYRMIPLRRGDTTVLVQGGRFFPERTEARLVGSTFGGRLLHLHWIRVGMCMEIDPGTGDGPITTTRVLDVAIDCDLTTDARPH